MPSDSDDDHYTRLGVREDTGEAELRRVWRELVRKWHPDRAGQAATGMFQKLSAAYAVLSDPVQRAAYDRARRAPAFASPTVRPRPAPTAILRRLSVNLNVLLAHGLARQAADGAIELILDAHEAASGGHITIPMRVQVRCVQCAGDETKFCPRCGRKRAVDELLNVWLDVPPGSTDGATVKPRTALPGLVRPLVFRVRIAGPR